MSPQPASPKLRSRDRDQFVRLHGISWAEFEALLAMRGDQAGVRVAYLEGELELMSPSREHERIKTTLARLLEAYAEERGIPLNGFGSWTLKEKLVERGVEPDECYEIGEGEGDVPDLAIEVVWTHGGLGRLSIYEGLGVPEIWIWEEGAIRVRRLGDDGYDVVEESPLFPDLDLDDLARRATAEDQTEAVRSFRESLR